MKKTKKPTETEILNLLRSRIPMMVAQTVSRYKNNSLSVIFDTESMTALADDTALEVLRRVKIGLKKPTHPDAVDLKGAVAYFKRAFINQTLKQYEKHGKTDRRAGIKTLTSEKAMAVAANKNLYMPEDSYIISDQINQILSLLTQSDEKFNKTVVEFYSKLGKDTPAREKQFYNPIVNGLLDGKTANEICEEFGFDMTIFLRQKRLAFELVKESMPNCLSELMEHFESKEDLRVHRQEVNKRKKLKQELKEYTPKAMFFVQMKNDKRSVMVTLFAQIEMYDSFNNKSKRVEPKLVSLESVKCKKDENEVNTIKNRLLALSKSLETKQKIDQIGASYLEEIKNKAI